MSDLFTQQSTMPEVFKTGEDIAEELKAQTVEPNTATDLLLNDAKKFVRYQEGAEKYSLGLTKFQELAKEAKAVYKIDKVALVNCEIFERYLESFHIL